MNPVYRASQIAAIVAAPQWGGGVHRAHLRELLGCDHRELRQALGIAYRRRQIDFCWSFVVRPPQSAARERAA